MKKIISSAALIFGLLVLTLSSGCSSKKIITDAQMPEVNSNQSPKQRFDALTSTYQNWDELAANIKLDIYSPMSIGASGKAYMKRGEWTYVSMRVFGMEVVNMYVNRDSIFATDKINHQYVAESISNVFSGISLEDIQNMFLGRVIEPGGNSNLKANDFDFQINDKEWVMNAKHDVKGATYGYKMNLDNNMPENLWINYKENNFKCDYSSPVLTPFGPMMNVENINCLVKNKKISLKIKWSLDNASWKIDDKPQWKMPSGYKKISLTKMIQM